MSSTSETEKDKNRKPKPEEDVRSGSRGDEKPESVKEAKTDEKSESVKETKIDEQSVTKEEADKKAESGKEPESRSDAADSKKDDADSKKDSGDGKKDAGDNKKNASDRDRSARDGSSDKEEGTGKKKRSRRAGKAVKTGFFKRFGKYIVIVILILLAAFIISRIYATKQKMAELANMPKQEFRNVERRDIMNSIAVTAYVEANDKRTVSTLVSNTKVLDVNFEVGDYVQEGDIICTFDTTNVSENMARLKRKMNVTSEKNRINVNDSTVKVNKAGTTWAYDTQDNLTSASRMQDDYNRALSEYYNACDGYNNAKNERDSKSSAYDAAKNEYDRAVEAYNTLTDEEKAGAVELTPEKKEIKDMYTYYSGQLSSAEAALKATRSAVETYENNIRTNETSVEAARRKLEDANIKVPRDYIRDNVEVQLESEQRYIAGLDASIANDDNEKTMLEYEELLEDSVVRAPISGVITSLNVHRGDEFAERTKTDICVIQDDSSYIAKGNVDEYNISKVQEGMRALIKTQATGEDKLEGNVTFVSPVPAGQTSQTSAAASGTASAGQTGGVVYPVEIRLAGRDDRLRLGMTAETSLVINKRDRVLVVPYDCIDKDKYGNDCVYIALGEVPKGSDAGDMSLESQLGGMMGAAQAPEDVETKKVMVQVGLETDYYVEITSDEIKEGDKVLVINKDDDTDTDTAEDDGPAMTVQTEGGDEDATEEVTAGAGGI